MPGLAALPAGTLLERALRLLEQGPTDSVRISREVLRLPRAPAVVADRLAAALLGESPSSTSFSGKEILPEGPLETGVKLSLSRVLFH